MKRISSPVSPKPPKIAHKILERVSSKDIRYSALGDLEEIFTSIAKEKGLLRAKLWYWKQAAKSLLPFLMDSIYWRVHMLQNYLKIAFRKMGRQKIFSFINMVGLAIGMAVCILIFLWVQDEVSYDRFHKNSDSIHRILMNDKNYGVIWPVVSIPVGPALKEDYPEIIDTVRINDFLFLISKEEKRYEQIGAYVDPSFFDIFTFGFEKGDPKTALSNPSALVLTQSLAKKIFGNEDPLGKNLRLNNRVDYTVTGVIKDVPRNSHIQFSFLLPFKVFEQNDREPTHWGRFQVYTYIQLKEKTSFKEVEGKISGVLQDHGVRSGPKLELEPLTRIHLYSSDGGGDIRYVYIFSIIAIFVLVIACINFVNLTTARSSTRAKEIGFRKVTGAKRTDLIKQFIGESVLISFIALIIAAALVWLLLPAFNTLSSKQLSLNPQGNWNLILGFLGIILFTGLLAGSYPAFFLSSFKPANILRGTLTPRDRGSNKNVLRKTLVVFQFSISIFLIVATLVIFKQLHFIKNTNLGYEREHVISIPIRTSSAQQAETFKNELLRDSRIQNVSATSELPVQIYKIHTGYDWEGKDPEKESRLYEIYVDQNFIQTMKMTIVQGRDFSKDIASDASEAYIVNEAAVKAMEIDSPVGKRFSAPSHEGMREGTLIGVVKDFHFKPLHDMIEPLVMFIYPNNFSFFCIRVDSAISDLPGTIKYIESVWKKFTPNFPFKYSFLDDRFDRMYRSEQNTGRIFSYFTFLAILISCLGLFGLAVLIIEMRTKEIGIRKILGASVPGITTLLSKDFLKWVVVANVISWPTAYFAMNKWLQNFAYRTGMGIGIFILATVLTFLIALVTVSFQSIRAALADPVNSLRYE